MKKIKSISTLLLLILVISLLLRLWRLDFPKAEVFDEVYYPFTAQEYLKGNAGAWDWSTIPPKGHAYAWVNPPLAQEIMAVSMKVFGTDNFWAARLPGVLLGVFSIYLVFLIGKQLFKNEKTALMAAFLFSLDGLSFVQSRTGMLDIYLLTFILISVLFGLKKSFFWSAIFLGLAIGNKWTGFYVIPFFLFLTIKEKSYLSFLWYPLLIPLVYLAVYTPFFLTGHSFQQFIGLLQQEWYYHLHLKDTHDYASSWWSWPLNLYPVWYYVEYYPNNTLSNIFASGNPFLYWLGSISILYNLWTFVKTRSFTVLSILIPFALLWLPWAASPRLMFLYYFLPAVPFLCLSLAYQLDQLYQEQSNRLFVKGCLGFCFIFFLIMYPIYVGLPLPHSLLNFFFFTNLAKNPFGG